MPLGIADSDETAPQPPVSSLFPASAFARTGRGDRVASLAHGEAVSAERQ
ncbi:hypothetical protein ACFFQF_07180 [Haladaptatus pallidirubidus]|nr:hypothetical protein [Haladaptatus pallidirubidus]